MRTLRISAFSNDFTPLSGPKSSGGATQSNCVPCTAGLTLVILSSNSVPILIDADLNTQKPGDAVAGIVNRCRVETLIVKAGVRIESFCTRGVRLSRYLARQETMPSIIRNEISNERWNK